MRYLGVDPTGKKKSTVVGLTKYPVLGAAAETIKGARWIDQLHGGSAGGIRNIDPWIFLLRPVTVEKQVPGRRSDARFESGWMSGKGAVARVVGSRRTVR
jgi:hypothetical protein